MHKKNSDFFFPFFLFLLKKKEAISNFFLSIKNRKIVQTKQNKRKFMTYAIIETGGHQLVIQTGGYYDTNKLSGVNENSKIRFNRVLLIKNEKETVIGQPTIKNALVEGRVLKTFKAPKILVYKMRPKKKTRRRYGHRQRLTRFLIETIQLNGQEI